MTNSQKTMTTQDVANRLVELCRNGEIFKAQEELYSDDINSIEPAHSMLPSVKGKKSLDQKGVAFAATIEERHGGSFSDPIVAGNFFTTAIVLDATIKGQGRMTLEEIGVYEVKDGKIVLEQFFF